MASSEPRDMTYTADTHFELFRAYKTCLQKVVDTRINNLKTTVFHRVKSSELRGCPPKILFLFQVLACKGIALQEHRSEYKHHTYSLFISVWYFTF